MSGSKYKVIVEGTVREEFDRQQVTERLAALLKTDSDRAAIYLAGRPVVLKSDLSRKRAALYQQALSKIGVACRVETVAAPKSAPPGTARTPMPPCPKCGHVPTPEEEALRDQGECPACHVIVAKYLAARNKRKQQGYRPQLAQKMRTSGRQSRMAKVGLVLAGFGIVCLLSSCGVSCSRGNTIREHLPPEGGTVGPVVVTSNRSVYRVEVAQPISRDREWSSISGEVLDANRNHLFGFGDEFWKESGRDSDGHWTESKTSYTMKFTLQRGTYYLGFESDRSRGVKAPIRVIVSRATGSGLPFLLAGIVGLVLGVALTSIGSSKSN